VYKKQDIENELMKWSVTL